MASQITGVSIVYSTVCLGIHQRKCQSSASLAFVREIHRWSVNSPYKRPVTRKMFPFDVVIMKWYRIMLQRQSQLLHHEKSPAVVWQSFAWSVVGCFLKFNNWRTDQAPGSRSSIYSNLGTPCSSNNSYVNYLTYLKFGTKIVMLSNKIQLKSEHWINGMKRGFHPRQILGKILHTEKNHMFKGLFNQWFRHFIEKET